MTLDGRPMKVEVAMVPRSALAMVQRASGDVTSRFVSNLVLPFGGMVGDRRDYGRFETDSCFFLTIDSVNVVALETGEWVVVVAGTGGAAVVMDLRKIPRPRPHSRNSMRRWMIMPRLMLAWLRAVEYRTM